MFRTRPLLSILLLCAATRSAGADEVARLSALAKMPVKEITVFKDGHAFVLHEGKMPTDAQGDVQMDYLPTPVIGTFWPYSADKNVKLQAVTASPRRVLVERTALTIPDLLEANPGADVNITQTDGKTYSAQIVGVPTRNDAEQEATDLEHSTGKLPEKGALLLVKSGEGTSVLPFDHIRDVTFRGPYKKTLGFEEFRNLLTLKLEWPGGRAAKTADVGMVYLQKGVRWIPSYKVTLDGKGGASIALEATMINEMTDLNDVTANLVIGVPSFFFQGTLDPISLQQSFAQLSPYFQNGSQTGFAMSNSLMSQTARMGDQGEPGPAGPAGPGIGPAVAGSKQDEDLFVFTVKHVTLKKGQRMVLPIAEYSLKYQDIYAIDLPYAPPREMRASNNSAQQEDLARLMSAPKAQHKIRMLNNGKFPLTTAPALILSGDRVLAQSLMTYAAIGANEELELTTAVDVKVKKVDKETQRTPNAANWQGAEYGRIDLSGTISVTNYQDHPVELEITRNVLGNVGKADHEGVATMVNVLEDDEAVVHYDYPYWWGWYNWPGWWNHFNGVGRIKWKLTLAPGKSVDLGYTWNYYWR